MTPQRIRLLFVLLGDETHPCSRVRALQYLPYLNGAGMRVDIFQAGSSYGRFGYFIGLLWRVISCDVVFLQRCPVSCFVFKTFKILGKKIIFDFDDAIFLRGPRDALSDSFFLARFEYILRNSDLVLAGNEYLAEYARRFSDHVTILPSVIDMEKSAVERHKAENTPVVIGWVGTEGNLFYVEHISGVLQKLISAFGAEVEIRVISSSSGNMDHIPVTFRKWSLETESKEVSQFDIGIMPLKDDKWTKGKCGYKALQYMAAGIPCVCSPVGMLQTLVRDGKNGYLATTEDDWFDKLSALVTNKELRSRIGKKARETVAQSFALKHHGPIFVRHIMELKENRSVSQ